MKRLSATLALLFYFSILPPLGSTAPVIGDLIVKSSPYVDVRAYGAANAVTLAGVQAAVDASGGKPVVIPAGTVDFSGTVTLPNARTVIICDNATINQTGGVPTFLQENRAYTEIRGCEFTGDGIPIKFNMALTGTMSLDGLIEGNRFLQDAGVYGVWLYGSRTVYLRNNLFSGGGNGIYMQSVCLPFISDSTFKGTSNAGIGTGNGILYNGDGLGTSCGLGLRDSEILGYDNGLIIRYADWGSISGSTIDYNNNSIRLESTASVTIAGGNYIGGSQVYDNAAIWIGQGEGAVGTPDYANHIKVQGNDITGHRESGTAYDAIRITGGSVDVDISGNTIIFWNRYGINADNVINLTVFGNYTSPRATFGTAALYNSGDGGDSTWLIAFNQFGTYGADAASTDSATYANNIGHSTRDCGQTTYDNVTAKYIPFNGTMAATPNTLYATPSKNVGAYWTDNVTTTGFTYNSDNAVSSTVVYWCAEKRTD